MHGMQLRNCHEKNCEVEIDLNTNLDFILLYVCYECLAVEGVVGVPVHVQHIPDMN